MSRELIPIGPCCVCGTPHGPVRQDNGRPYRYAVEQYGGPPGRACGICRQRLKRAWNACLGNPSPTLATIDTEYDEPEPADAESIRLIMRAWKRARAARLIGLAQSLGKSWRQVRPLIDLTVTTSMRRI